MGMVLKGFRHRLNRAGEGIYSWKCRDVHGTVKIFTAGPERKQVNLEKIGSLSASGEIRLDVELKRKDSEFIFQNWLSF